MANHSKTTARGRKRTRAKNQPLPRSPEGRAKLRPAPRRKTATPAQRKTGPEAQRQPETGATRFTFHVNPTLTLVCLPDDTPAVFSLETAAQLTGVHPEMLRYYCRAGLVDSIHGISESELFFEGSALQQVRRIEHYRRDLAVGRQALPLICELQQEAERRHVEIRFLRARE